MAKAAAAKKPTAKAPTKTEIFGAISESTGVSKKDVGAVFEALSSEIAKALSSKGPGVFQIPGLLKINKQKVAARPAQKNAPNPFKPGEFRDIPARPAHNKIKVRALKSLKDMA